MRRVALTLALMTIPLSPASSAIYTLTVTGAASGIDRLNYFGLGDAYLDIKDTPYTEVFQINDNAGAISSKVTGSTSESTGFSFISASFKLNGKTLDAGYDAYSEGYILKTAGAVKGRFDLLAYTGGHGAPDVTGATFKTTDPAFNSSPDFRVPFDIGSLNGTGAFLHGLIDLGPDGGYDNLISLYTTVEHATFAESAVPEPASYAMMISGIGTIGGAMRKRRVIRRYA